MKFIKKIVWDFLNILGLGGMIQLQLKSGLKDDGWFRSFETKRPIDKNGQPVAWYSYSFLKFLENRLTKDLAVFEYGAGNSTIWYAKKVKFVKSVENDKKWVEILTPQLPKNAEVTFRELNQTQDYLHEITIPAQAKSEAKSEAKYDIIVVDGRRRNDCAMFGIDYLTEKGVIILDNSEREDYQPTKDFMKQKGFKQIDFWGIAPIVAHNTCTSVFYKANNCLDI